MTAVLAFVHALTPLHAGTGQGVGVIDLPIAREKATGLPYLPGSSLKGTLRAHDAALAHHAAIFGPDTANAADHAGAVQFTDQRLLALPVRSLAGTFAWVTSPLVLRRLARDARDCGINDAPTTIPAPQFTEHGATCHVASTSLLCIPLHNQPTIVLEDLDLHAQRDADAWAQWIATRSFPGDDGWQAEFKRRFCVVHDDVLLFLLTTATEVFARVALQEDVKTVKQGALWYEEALPSETILSGLIVATDSRRKDKSVVPASDMIESLRALTKHPMQFGGKSSVGRGLCYVRL